MYVHCTHTKEIVKHEKYDIILLMLMVVNNKRENTRGYEHPPPPHLNLQYIRRQNTRNTHSHTAKYWKEQRQKGNRSNGNTAAALVATVISTSPSTEAVKAAAAAAEAARMNNVSYGSKRIFILVKKQPIHCYLFVNTRIQNNVTFQSVPFRSVTGDSE